MLETLYSIMESEDDGSRSVIEDQAKGLVDALLSVAQDQKKGEGSPVSCAVLPRKYLGFLTLQVGGLLSFSSTRRET